MRIGVRVILGVVICLVVVRSYGQASLSPYSTLGIGDPKSLALAHNEGMGGLGLARGYTFWLNYMNPALLPYNEFSVFQIGLFGDYRSYQQGSESGQSGGANLNYLAVAFPLKDRKWSMMIGLNPFSSVNYNFSFDGRVETDPSGGSTDVVFAELGKGGINQFSLSTGYNLFKGFNIGVKASYMFGAIKRESSNIINDLQDPALFIPVVYDRQNVSDLAFGTGLAYRLQMGETNLDLGFIYDLDMNLNATRLTRVELRNPDNETLQVDTINSNLSGNIFIPSQIGGGFAFSKDFKWTVGMDFYSRDWSAFRNFEGTNADGFESTFKAILGGEFVPNFSNPKSYFDRVSYRAGFSFETIPYTFDAKQIREIGINIGWSLPVGRYSVLDIAARYGRRGTTADGLIQEQYFRFFFGATFNDKWFQRRKFN